MNEIVTIGPHQKSNQSTILIVESVSRFLSVTLEEGSLVQDLGQEDGLLYSTILTELNCCYPLLICEWCALNVLSKNTLHNFYSK